MTPSQRARADRSRAGRPRGEHNDTRAFAHAVARACDQAFPHPVLSKIPAKKLNPDQQAELKAWRQAHR